MAAPATTPEVGFAPRTAMPYADWLWWGIALGAAAAPLRKDAPRIAALLTQLGDEATRRGQATHNNRCKLCYRLMPCDCGWPAPYCQASLRPACAECLRLADASVEDLGRGTPLLDSEGDEMPGEVRVYRVGEALVKVLYPRRQIRAFLDCDLCALPADSGARPCSHWAAALRPWLAAKYDRVRIRIKTDVEEVVVQNRVRLRG